jgi:hypothetical protein
MKLGKLSRREILLAVLMVTLLAFACTQKALVKADPPATKFNYEKFLQQRYDEVETKEAEAKSSTWRAGMLKEYGLILDHVQMRYKAISENVTSDNKCLVCGFLIIVGYGKTQDGVQNRIVSRRAVCHLFDGEKLTNALTIASEPNVLLVGWSEGAPI